MSWSVYLLSASANLCALGNQGWSISYASSPSLSKQEKCMSTVKKRGLQDMQYIGPW
jgi:hypothetical protein